MDTSEKLMDRREFWKWLIGGTIITAAALANVSDAIRKISIPRIFPNRIDRSVGQEAIPIPNEWYRTLDSVSIDSVPLNKSQVDSLPMPRIDYSRVCNCNPKNFIHTTKYGLSLPEAFDRLKIQHKGKGQVMIVANDWYALVPAEVDKTFFSASKDNLPRAFWSDSGLEKAKEVRMTPYGVFVPYGKGGGQAWKDLVDIKDVGFRKQEVESRTYFVGPDGKIIQPENKSISMSLDNLVLMVNNVRVPYSKIKEYAEQNLVVHDSKEVPSIAIDELLRLSSSGPKNTGLILHANNYAVSIPPWRQHDLTILFDKQYANRYGVPTKLIGGEFLNKAAQVEGLYRIDTFPMST